MSVSVEEAFRTLIRNEVEAQFATMRDTLNQLQDLAQQLAPLTALVASFTGGRVAPVAPRRVGRPPKALATGAEAGRPRATTGANARACAIIGCPRPARTKGYCSAHYQKLRMLTKTNRLPATWVDFAPPQSVPDVVLPRGRAASKALAAAKAK